MRRAGESMGFFDDYPRFLETSQTGATVNRLNKRHRAIFETAPGLFRNARVLDIASHDGRWSFSALKAGASHVVGVEPREHLISNARETLRQYGFDQTRFEFVQDDIFAYLARGDHGFDVVMCLGFFYHTYRHPELMALIRGCKPKTIIVDSQVHNVEGMVCAVRKDRVSQEYEASTDASTHRGMTYVAMPSPALLRDFLAHYGYDVQAVDWSALLADDKIGGVQDYAEGKRVTLVCRARD